MTTSPKKRPTCSCGLTRDAVTGLCPAGCEKFRRPSASLTRLNARLRDREKRSDWIGLRAGAVDVPSRKLP